MSQNLIKLENVYFLYPKIAEAQKDPFDVNGLTKKFSVTACLSKADAKEFKKLKLNKTIKEISGEEFRTKYKIDPPEAFANEDDEYFIVGFSQKATFPDGNPTPEWTWPKTYLLEDGKPVDRTSTLVGNGSFGDLRISTRESKANGQVNTYLHSILVKDLIPVERRGDEWANAAEDAGSAPGADDELPF